MQPGTFAGAVHYSMGPKGTQSKIQSAELRFADTRTLCGLHFEDLKQLSSEVRKDVEDIS